MRISTRSQTAPFIARDVLAEAQAIEAAGDKVRVIPTCTDQNPCAHSRMPIEMIFHGRSMSLFQASQQSATMSS